jgi:hypothetical protein
MEAAESSGAPGEWDKGSWWRGFPTRKRLLIASGFAVVAYRKALSVVGRVLYHGYGACASHSTLSSRTVLWRTIRW